MSSSDLGSSSGVVPSTALVLPIDPSAVQVRGVFDASEDPDYWRSAVARFPNGIPRFQNKEDYFRFMNSLGFRPSNPDEPRLYHSITMFTSWNQIKKYVVPKMVEYNGRWAAARPEAVDLNGNRFYSSQGEYSNLTTGVYDYLKSRLDLSIHRKLSVVSTENTLNYLFYHMRCGIYGMIRNNKLVMYCPFVNRNYKNTWHKCLTFDCPEGDVFSYYQRKGNDFRPENYLPDMDDWWANGNIICNAHQKDGEAPEDSQLWGDTFIMQMKDMIAETCRTRKVPDCDFFLNKRDYPQIKFHNSARDDASSSSSSSAMAGEGYAVEPYGFIFDKDDRKEEEDVPLAEHSYPTYAPVLSFYTSSRFADIPFPSTEDWESATGEIFVGSLIPPKRKAGVTVDVSSPRDLYTERNFRRFECAWDKKRETAFFRGTATGGGVTPETNQRLHAALLSHRWNMQETERRKHLSEEDAAGAAKDYVPLLDAKITGWNFRDKKIATGKVSHINPKSLPFNGGAENFTPIYEQSTFKYLVYIEGHCAACRYGFMMRLGSVILKVESSCVADQMWYFPLLRPYEDHVPVKADLSDLKEKIEWCRSHDEECKKIAQRAKELYDRFVSKEGILDYMQLVFYEIAKRTVPRPEWAQQQELPLKPPSLARPGEESRQCCCVVAGEPKICAMCAEKKKNNAKRKLDAMQAGGDEARNEAEEKRKRMRARMLKQRQEQQGKGGDV